MSTRQSRSGRGKGPRLVGRPPSRSPDHQPIPVREALLAAARRQLETNGDPAAVTVASVVAEAGCTPPALYHYWPTRDLLLRETCERGWTAFRQSQERAVQTLPGPVERIRSRGRAYLTFALERPALFRVLFMTAPPDAEPSPDRSPAGPAVGGVGAALNDLIGDVTAAIGEGLIVADDPLLIALTLWSTVHGVAALPVATPALPDETAFAVFEQAHDALLRGLAPPAVTHSAASSPAICSRNCSWSPPTVIARRPVSG